MPPHERHRIRPGNGFTRTLVICGNLPVGIYIYSRTHTHTHTRTHAHTTNLTEKPAVQKHAREQQEQYVTVRIGHGWHWVAVAGGEWVGGTGTRALVLWHGACGRMQWKMVRW
jgi:hypothetical protein